MTATPVEGQFRAKVVDEDGEAVLALYGVVDVNTAAALRRELVNLHVRGVRHVVVDLAGVELIDSSGLGVLVGALRRFRAADGDLALRSPTLLVRKLLDVTGLSRVLEVRP